MPLEKTFIPYGCYWSTPFCRWQGSLADHNALELAARVAGRFFEQRQVPPETLESLVLGYTVPQKHFFYGAPWVAGMMASSNLMLCDPLPFIPVVRPQSSRISYLSRVARNEIAVPSAMRTFPVKWLLYGMPDA